MISDEEGLKSLTAILGEFRDKCIQLQFLQAEYLDKINDKNEKALLVRIKNEWQDEKQVTRHKLNKSLEELHRELQIPETSE